jgi:hypothetical protein
MLEQLIEETRNLYDWIALLWAAFGEAPGKEWLVYVNYRRAPFLFQTPITCFWTRVIENELERRP